MTFEMTSGNLVQLGLGAVMFIGLVLLIIGAVLLIRSRVHGPDTHVEAGTVRIIAGPAAMILIAGMLLLGGGGFFLSQTVTGQPAAVNAPSTSPVIPAPTSASPSPRPTAPFANVTYPLDETKVSRQNGFVMGGTVADPGPWTIWILDHPSAHSYFVDVKATVQMNGDWSAADLPLGDASDSLPFKMTVVAVTANPECARALDQASASAATDHLAAMPHGCYQFGQRTVNVTRS